jgi:RHS repeat-associated protein
MDQPLAQVVSGTTTYNLADHLGSIVRTTDSLGNPTLTRQYDPWGNPIQGATTSGYAFTGREWDAETSVYYYRARYYEPRVGRFLSEDPIGSARVSRYTYSSNTPAMGRDPSGLDTIITVGTETTAFVRTGHTSLFAMSGASDGSEFIYDPSGSYHFGSRSRNGVFEGDEANLFEWMEFESENYEIEVYWLKTTPKEECEIYKRAVALGEFRGPYCALHLSRAVVGLPTFPGVVVSRFPETLASGLRGSPGVRIWKVKNWP